MLGLKSKPRHAVGPDVHHVVYRSRTCGGPVNIVEPATQRQARQVFDICVAKGWFTPTNGRRILVTGPDHLVQPEDHNDPLLIGAAAVRAVLSDAEFEAFAAQTVRYALEAE